MTVPACLNPLMLAMQGGDPLDELGRIERSVRLRNTAVAHLARTLVVPTDGRKLTINFDLKLGVKDVVQYLQSAYRGAANTGDNIYLYATGAFGVAGTSGGSLYYERTTNRLFRDYASHINVHIEFDSTQAIAADRIKIAFDGNYETSFASATNPSLNALFYQNSAGNSLFGVNGWSINYPFGGLLSNYKFIDGAAINVSAFGMSHPRTKQFRTHNPARIRAAVAAAGSSVRNGWGANGCFSRFDDPTSLMTLGYDRSQSDTDTTGNNWTSPNISLTAGPTYDSMLDTPTNNFCTLNPLEYYNGGALFSGGNLSIDAAGANTWRAVATQALPNRGVWCWESGITESPYYMSSGIVKQASSRVADVIGSGDSISWGWYAGNGLKYNNSVGAALGTPFSAATDVLGHVFDADNGTLSLFKNGVLLGGGAAFTGLVSGPYFPAITNDNATAGLSWVNFGQRPMLYSYGSAKPLCTKNLPFPNIANPKSAFVAVTDTGANIAATLAEARSGWPDYIDIIKRRDAAEVWRWIFSDDPTNYLDSSSTAAKVAVPALSGTAYVGYSLKVDASNGVATGRLTHVSGTADTVVDDLANSRKLVILKNEASGTWYVYHPDLTSGKLLYLEQTAAETTDATISNVTASGFTVAAALPSGTYRWISLSEVDGFLKLFKDTGNGSTDGPYDALSMMPGLYARKLSVGPTASWHVFDAARNKGNVCDKVIYFDAADAEVTETVNLVDLDSGGAKLRGTHTYTNGSGSTFVGIAIADFPFRYANAR